ncbi:hypothetical protein ACO1O0_008504 [Amphichorda felina]
MPPATAVEEPKRQEPMEMDSGDKAIVTAQPDPLLRTGDQAGLIPVVNQTSEPRPSPDNQPQMTLRGGGIFCGFDCCDGACRFHKGCC